VIDHRRGVGVAEEALHIVGAESHSRAKKGLSRPPRRFSRPRFAEDTVAIHEGLAATTTLLREGLHRRALIVADVVAALTLAAAVAIGGDRVAVAEILLAAPVIVFINKIAGLYERDEVVLRKSTLEEAPALVQVAGIFGLVIFLLPGGALERADRSGVLVVWGGAFLLLVAGRVLARAVAERFASAERCLAIGSAQDLQLVAKKIESSRVKADIVATLELPADASPRHLEALPPLLLEHGVDRVIIASTGPDATGTLEAVRLAKEGGVRISLVPRLFEAVGSAVEFDEVGGLTMLGVRRSRLSRSSRLLKRGFDLVVATFAIVVLAPLMAIIAIAIRLETPGAVLFRQVRIGRNGRPFRIFKFRSMVADAERRKADLSRFNEADEMFKIANDPRITRVGRVIRRSCLDELPQLFNVWRGEMSLVGPRPLITDEDRKIVGLDRSRLYLTPGMTGPWQVLGSTRIPMHEMVAIDYLYVNTWTLWRDLKLIIRTVPLMLSRASV
jgi:exopolysaccharide biosynthesis polyprenyl glycosylphosphotransferase